MKEYDVVADMTKLSKHGLKSLGLLEIDNKDEDVIRIWRFPEGGAVFEEMYEVSLKSKSFNYHSYLIKSLSQDDKNELAQFEFSRKVSDEQNVGDLMRLIKQYNFIEAKSDHEICNDSVSLSDYFLIEFKLGNKINKFGLGEAVKECTKIEARGLKELYDTILKIVNRLSPD